MLIYWLAVIVITFCFLFILGIADHAISIILFNYLKKRYKDVARKLTIDGSLNFENSTPSLFDKWKKTVELNEDNFVRKKKILLRKIKMLSLLLTIILVISIIGILIILVLRGIEF